MKSKHLLLALTGALLASCSSNQSFEDNLVRTLNDKPEIITKLIEQNPEKFITAFQNAAKKGQAELAQRRNLEEQKQLEAAFNNPLKPVIRKDELIRGKKGAPITIVEYSDFECPFCTRGFNTVTQVLKKYEGKVQFVYKHLPLSFHPNAMIASKYYEALRIQDEKLAVKLHDEIFKNQRQLKNGDKFLKSLSKKLGANMSKLAKDLKSSELEKRIKDDMEEAAKFGMQGTPGFIINGVPIRGAYPLEKFDQVIQELQQRGKLKI
ncbi:thioredoxin domain-containing protein [Halobacteriovorax sp. HLS]|uniref:DsbA family protein n=1 Tax=Halobacteriovorax sp. HLS TaxID=2234000 RepID=UPI000FD79734|nr:thioredoxin domain-containing protein [Halobacteriovorax sp. HLS]